MANDITRLGQLAGTRHLSSMLSSQGHFPKTPTVKYLKSYRSIKTFGIQAVRYGWLGYVGSNRGAGNETGYGMTCESPAHFLLTFRHLISPHIPALMSTSACGTSGNTETQTQIFLRL